MRQRCTERKRGYVIVCNETAQTGDLPLEAKGLLMDLLSRPDNYVVSINRVCDNYGISKNKASRILRDLEHCGYLVRLKTSYGKRGFEYMSVIKEHPSLELPDHLKPESDDLDLQDHKMSTSEDARPQNEDPQNEVDITEKEDKQINSLASQERGPALGTEPPDGSHKPVLWQENWSIPDIWIREAMQSLFCPPHVAQREASKFADYWLTRHDAKAKKSNWRATWRNWIRRAMEGNDARSAHDQHDQSKRREAIVRHIAEKRNSGTGLADGLDDW